MYNFRYDSWDAERFPGYQTSMNELYDHSLSFYVTNTKESDEKEKDIHKLNELFGYMEYYLAAILKLRYVGKSNFQNVLSQMEGIQLIKLLDPTLRSRLNGLTYNQVITLNPYPGNYPGLNQIHSLQLSLFHEMGHIVTASNKEDLEYLKKCVFRPKMLMEKFPNMEDAYEFFGKGFDLLDEVAVQNVAEAVLYDRMKEQRPQAIKICNKRLYPNGILLSSFLEYREFQELAYRFAKCLSFLDCSEEEGMDEVLNRLSKAMFSRDFPEKLYMEFMKDPERGDDLVMMLICMGRIKDAKYASFGLSNREESLDVSSSFELFNELSSHERSREDRKVIQKVQS